MVVWLVTGNLGFIGLVGFAWALVFARCLLRCLPSIVVVVFAVVLFLLFCILGWLLSCWCWVDGYYLCAFRCELLLRV